VVVEEDKMSIIKQYGKYVAVCDICEQELPGEDDFDDAVEEKKQAGWKTRKDGDEWVDICCDCQEDFDDE